MYNVHTKTVPTNLGNFVKISKKHITIIRDYQQMNVSRIEERKTSFTRINMSNWNSIPLSVNSLNKSNFRKK